MNSTPSLEPECVQDRLDITDLVYRYAQGVDDRDIDAVLACVSPDAILSLNNGETVLHGRKDLRNYLVESFKDGGVLSADVASTHLMVNVIVNVTGDRAHAETTAVTYRAGDGMVITRGIRYTDECAKIAGRWVISRRTHRARWQSQAPGQTFPQPNIKV
jgi:ketosteroid isomerase-like protein